MSQNLLTWADGIIKEAAGYGELFQKFKELIDAAGKDSQYVQLAREAMNRRSDKQLIHALSLDKDVEKMRASSDGHIKLTPKQQAVAQAYMNRKADLHNLMGKHYPQNEQFIFRGQALKFPGGIGARGSKYYGNEIVAPTNLGNRGKEFVEQLQNMKDARPWVQAEKEKKQQQIRDLMKYFGN